MTTLEEARAAAMVVRIKAVLKERRNDPRSQLRSIVLGLARAAGAEDRERPWFQGARTTVTYAEPVAGIYAALVVQRIAAGTVETYVREARGEGVSWQVIGQALDLVAKAKEEGRPLGEFAYDFVAGEPGDTRREVTLGYTCGSCGQGVSDRGPYNSHPADNERGHAGECVRFNAEVSAFEQAKEW